MEGPRSLGVCGWAMENDDTEVAKERLDYTGDGLIFSMSENLSCTFQKKPRQKRGFLRWIILIGLR